MLFDQLHQILPKDLPALQEARGGELCDTTASLCKGKPR